MNDFPKQQQLIHSLLDPERTVLGKGKVRLIETHISWVLLAGRHAYKIKKAVNLGFLDCTSLEARRFYCAEELRLNRRLAPQLYLDVLPIGGTVSAPLPGQLPAMEYAVRMRRFPQKNLLGNLLALNQVLPQQLDQLAILLADFHGSLAPAAAGTTYGTPASVSAAAMQNFEQLAPLLQEEKLQERLAALSRQVESELNRLQTAFARRRDGGCVRECHGDLHLGNIALVRGEAVPFDAIEFSAEYRWQDSISEIAFLVMDMLAHGCSGPAFRLLNTYLEAGGDYAGMEVFRFYISYRAMVRAKISAIRANQAGASAQARAAGMDACRGYLGLAEKCLSPGQPALIIMHGLPGSGKTTFSQQALERLGAIRIRSDVERKRLFGLRPLDDSRDYGVGEGLYGAEATLRTYARLAELSELVLRAGFPVVVDAAFLRRDERDLFRRLAAGLNVPFAIASVRASDAAMRRRLVMRQQQGRDASEADARVLAMLQAVQEPVSTEEEPFGMVFANDQTAEDGVGRPEEWLRLEQLAGMGAMQRTGI